MQQDVEKLIRKKIKPTAMRQLVLKKLIDSKTALSLQELENEFEMADRSTLFRTLKTFEQKKLIHSIDDGTGSVKYALCSDSCECKPEDLHVHFHCEGCGQTYCLDEIPVPAINLPATFSMDSVHIVIKGKCIDCK